MSYRSVIDYESVWRKVADLPWCALVASGRTGSDAFHSQLDSHPEIFVFNGPLFFHEFWTTAATVQAGGALRVEDIADEFIGRHIASLKSRYDLQENKHALGENMDQSIDIDLSAFKRHLVAFVKLRPVNLKTFLTGVYVAYGLSSAQDIGKKRLFFHHIHHVDKLDAYLNDFPDSRIIGMTRDPRAAYVSGVDHWRRQVPAAQNPSYPQFILWRIVDQMMPLLRHGDRFRALRLEDLGNEGVLREVCRWLGVSYLPCVLESTWNGLRWWGDWVSVVTPTIGMSEKEFVEAIRKSPWKQQLSAVDQVVLDYLLHHRLTAYSYEHRKMPVLVFGPIVFLAILLPTNFEREFLALPRLFARLAKGELRSVLSFPYHYARRVAYFYRLFFRRHWQWTDPPLFRAPPETPASPRTVNADPTARRAVN